MAYEDEYRNWVYRFRIDCPMHRDAEILMVIRDRFIEGEWQHEYLTTEGWRKHGEWEMLDVDSMPTMTGMQLHRDRCSRRALLDQVTMALRADAGEDARVEMIDGR